VTDVRVPASPGTPRRQSSGHRAWRVADVSIGPLAAASTLRRSGRRGRRITRRLGARPTGAPSPTVDGPSRRRTSRVGPHRTFRRCPRTTGIIPARRVRYRRISGRSRTAVPPRCSRSLARRLVLAPRSSGYSTVTRGGSNAQNMPPRTSSTSPVAPAQIGTYPAVSVVWPTYRCSTSSSAGLLRVRPSFQELIRSATAAASG
jgi:hypothetical protein